MPASDLYGEGASLLRGAASTASDIERNKQSEQKLSQETMESGLGAVRDVMGERRKAEATMALEKFKAQEKLIPITPQMALGLVRNTGDKEWLNAIGQEVRPDVLLGLYTHGMALNQAKKAPKITQIYDKSGKIRHAVVYTDEQGNQQELMLDEGMTPETLNKGKGGKGKGGTGSDDTFKKNKEFMRAHEKQAAVLDDPVKAKQLQVTNPDQYNRIKEEYEKDQDRYDQLKTSMGAAGDSATPAGGGSSASPDNTPFDADALIKEALSQK